MNVKKTKEILTDFRKAPTAAPDLFIDDVKVERMTEYKYLGMRGELSLTETADRQRSVSTR